MYARHMYSFHTYSRGVLIKELFNVPSTVSVRVSSVSEKAILMTSDDLMRLKLTLAERQDLWTWL